MTVRLAAQADAEALAALINRAYRVEAFFAEGDRTSPDDVRERLARPGGAFLVLDDARGIAGTVFVQVADRRGFFAMLAVDPDRQKQGLGRRLIEAVEAHCRAAGCRRLDMDIVNVREELPAFYARFGFASHGTAPFHGPGKLKRPAHLVLMTKALAIAVLVLAAACRSAPPGADPPSPESAVESAQASPSADRGATWDPWAEAATRGIDFRAVGNEPGWYLEVDYERWMRLLYAYGERQATVPAVQPVTSDGVTTFASSGAGHSLRAVASPGPCSDGMSDMTYPLTVMVTIDGVELRGCGRWLP